MSEALPVDSTVSVQPLRLAIAAPIYNEEKVLPEFLRRTTQVLDALPGGPHQLILVDDGSSDRSLEILTRSAATDSRLLVIALSRNFGHQAALSAALDHVAGDAVLVLDADLQDPPELLPQFLEEFRQGCDVVYAIRTQRSENALQRLGYALGYRLIKCLSSIDLPVDAGDFALLSRRVVEAIRSSKERSRYLRGLRSWVGFRQRGVPVKREARHAGQSKYTLRRLLGLTFDGLFAFSLVPLRFAMLVGVLSMAAALLYVGYAAYAKVVLSQSPAGFTALIVAITFLAGVQIFFLGVVGEYVGRIYEEVKQRPQYIVREIIRGGQAWTRHMPSDTPNCTKDIGGGALGNASS